MADPDLKSIWREGYYDECVTEAAKGNIVDTSLRDLDSRTDLLAIIGYMMKERERDNRNAESGFKAARAIYKDDSERVDWLAQDLRHFRAVVLHMQSERGVSVREAIDWLRVYRDDDALPGSSKAKETEATVSNVR